MNYKDILLDKINRLLSDEWTVPQFYDNYYLFELNEVPDNALNDDEMIFFGEVREELDWTTENLDEESRSYGWMDYKRYVQYVRKITQEFVKTGKCDWRKSSEVKSEILKKND